MNTFNCPKCGSHYFGRERLTWVGSDVRTGDYYVDFAGGKSRDIFSRADDS